MKLGSVGGTSQRPNLLPAKFLKSETVKKNSRNSFWFLAWNDENKIVTWERKTSLKRQEETNACLPIINAISSLTKTFSVIRFQTFEIGCRKEWLRQAAQKWRMLFLTYSWNRFVAEEKSSCEDREHQDFIAHSRLS